MADEVADSLATLNDVTDRGVPYRRMGDPCRWPTGPTLAAFSSVPRRCRWSPLSVLPLRARGRGPPGRSGRASTASRRGRGVPAPSSGIRLAVDGLRQDPRHGPRPSQPLGPAIRSRTDRCVLVPAERQLVRRVDGHRWSYPAHQCPGRRRRRFYPRRRPPGAGPARRHGPRRLRRRVERGPASTPRAPLLVTQSGASVDGSRTDWSDIEGLGQVPT